MNTFNGMLFELADKLQTSNTQKSSGSNESTVHAIYV